MPAAAAREPEEATPLPASSPSEGLAAWGAFLQAHALLIRDMDAVMRRESGLPLRSYDVLRQLAQAGGTLPQRELEQRVLLSQSGLSRLLSRLENGGLVSRARPEDDRRAALVALTAAGADLYRQAQERQEQEILRRFVAPLSAHQVGCLRRALRAIASEA
jgi:DNA-binding MarR family transcriptional regulator